MFNKGKSNQPTRTIKRPHYRGNKAALVAINDILNDHRFTADVRLSMAQKVAKAAITTETVAVFEQVVNVEAA